MSIFKTGIIDTNNPTGDAFGRLRVSTPQTVFDSKQIADNQPLFWDEDLVSGSGISTAHSVDTASTVITSTLNTAGNFIRQTFQIFNYQPGKSQLVLMTGIIGRSGGGDGVERCIGQFNDDNGLFFKIDNGVAYVVRRTHVTGSPVDNQVDQSSWNLDAMDGTGNSGITVDWSKTQIFVIDYEWLGVGRARMGLNIDGVTFYVHEFLNANTLDKVYMSHPNLPLRYQMITKGSSPVSTMECICASIISEGGVQNTGILRTTSTEGTHLNANSADTLYAVIGLRKKTTHLNIVVKEVSMSMLSETNDDFEWAVYLNPTVGGSFTYSDETNSAAQTAKGVTANTVSGGVFINGGFVTVQGSVSNILTNALSLGASIAGVRDEIVLCVRPLSASADIQASITWRELS